MPSLESIIPEISAYQQAQARGQQQQMGQLQQMGALQQLLNGPLRTQLLQAQVAEHQQAPELKRIGLKQSNEATMARLKQTADQFDTRMELAWKNAQRQEDKDAIEAQWKQGRLNLEQTAQRMAGERLFYDTGTRIAPAQTPQIAPQQQAPSFAQAMGAMGGRTNPPFTMQVDPTSPQPVNMPQQAPMAAPQQPMAEVPAPAPVAKKPGEFTAADAPAGMIAPRERARWAEQQNKPSIAGSGVMTPQALEFTAKQYLAGDRQASQGYARSATARIALQNAIVDEAAKQGLSPEQTAAKMAEFAGTMSGSRTVGQRAANISLAATEATEMLGIVKETSDKFGRTNFVPFNMALKAFESGTGSPEIAEFGASINALVNVYARAINPTGVPTVSDKEHARAVLNAVQSPAQVDAVLGIIRRELEIAKKAPAQVRAGIRESVTGGGSTAPNIDAILEKYK